MAHFSIFLCKVDNVGISSLNFLNIDIGLFCEAGVGVWGSSESELVSEVPELGDSILLLLLLGAGARMDLS